jgi:two-component system, OmpR family, phosphate regulon sensor histidine kinase PhoR
MDFLTILLALLLLIAIAGLLGLSLALHRAMARVRQLYTERAEALAQRGQLEADVAADQAHLAGLGEAASDALLLLDANRTIVWGNAVAWSVFGATGAQVGQSFISLVRDAELNQAVLDAVAGNRPIVRQTVAGSRNLRICAAPAGDTGGAAVCIQDVTELQRLGRARRDFVANISHELRTPLANIDLAAQTLRQGAASDPALGRRMLEQIHIQVQTLSQLSQEMMELAQIESGKVLLKLLPEEVEHVVRRSITHLLPQAAQKDQHISLVVPRGLFALMDEEQVSRVLGNLMHNAIKFTPEGGIISVHVMMSGAEDVCFCVSDTGPGIAREDQARIFERFFKADRARSQGAGTGLGLAIARHIVEGHGGRIWVESTPGQGATFCFTLPKA